MKQATFLWKNNRGIYFFRARIPKQFSEYFNGSEIKKSLKTDSYRLAVKLARAYRVEMDKKMWGELKEGTYGALEVTLEGKVAGRMPDGSEKPVEGKITRIISEGEDTTPHKEFLLKQLRAEAEQQEKQAREQALFNAQLAAIQNQVTTQTPPKDTKPPLMLSDAIQEYIEDKEALRS